MFREWDELKVKTKTKALMKEITDNMEGEVATLKEKHLTNNTERLTHNKKKI